MSGPWTGRRLSAAATALLLGCGHAEPFRVPDYGSDQPLQPGVVAQLTRSSGHDRAPVWLPADSGLLYAFERLDRSDLDGCLATLPATGGSQRWRLCAGRVERADSNESLLWPAVSPGGQLAYVFERRGLLAITYGPDYRQLVVTRLGNPAVRRLALSLPDSTDDGVRYASASHGRWLDEDRLLYRADLYFIARPPFRPDPRDTVTSGRAIVLATFGAGRTTLVVPGTDFASSLDVAGSDTLYYTLGGDGRVFRRILSSGIVDVIWDFSPEIARGVQIRGRRLAAVVGGTVRFGIETSIPEPVQRDSGGVLHVVQLDRGTVRAIDIGLPVRHPAFSASGDRIAVEAAVGFLERSTDLYLVRLDP